MIEARAFIHIDAPPGRVAALYADVASWPRTFPATIRGARVVSETPGELRIEVDQVEGKVVNLLRPKSPTRFELEEFKRMFDATFSNSFEPDRGGTRYVLTAQIRLKWPYRLLAPVVKPLIVSRMRRFVLEPMKAAAERTAPPTR